MHYKEMLSLLDKQERDIAAHAEYLANEFWHSHYNGKRLLAETVEVAKREGLVRRQSLERVTVNTTVQEKAITYPTDAKLYARGIRNLTKLAQQHGVTLRQSYARKAPEALLMVNRYAKARQMKRKRRMTKRLKTYLGRVTRDIERLPEATRVALQEPLHRANRLRPDPQDSPYNGLYAAENARIWILPGMLRCIRFSPVSAITGASDGSSDEWVDPYCKSRAADCACPLSGGRSVYVEGHGVYG